MRTWHPLLLTLVVAHCSCAQVSRMPVADSLAIPPGTIVVIASITETTKSTATLNVQEVVGSGQGIINALSAGQSTPVKMTAGIRLRPGQKVRAYLKEKLEADASRSSYEIVQIKSLKP
jgi:hypothetical protein